MTDDDLRRAYTPIAGHVPDNRSDCPSPEALRATVEHRDSESERFIVLRHVTECAACQRDLSLLRTVHSAAADRRVPRLWTSIGLAAVLLVGTVIVIGRLRPREVVRGEPNVIATIGPSGEVPAARPITLIWHPLAGATSYSVEVIDDSARAIFVAATPETTLVVRPGALLPGGRYYWSVKAAGRKSTPLPLHLTPP